MSVIVSAIPLCIMAGMLLFLVLWDSRRGPQQIQSDEARPYGAEKEPNPGQPGRPFEPAHDQGWHADEHRHRRWEKGYWTLYLVLSLIATGGAIVAAGAGIGALSESRRAVKKAGDQVTIARQQLSVTRDQERRSLRAYLSLASGLVPGSTIPWTRVIYINGVPAGIVAIENDGQTPAYGLTIHSAIEELPKKLPANFNFPTEKHITDPVINPRADHIVASPNIEIKPPDIERLKANFLYHYGTVFYRDAFGHNHWLNFCIYYIDSPETKNEGQSCNTHNNSDDSESHDTPP